MELELREEEKSFLASFELPGLEKEDVSISLEEGVLTIKGEKKHEVSEKRAGLHYEERVYGSFQRAVRLPKMADSAGISAEMKNGVLQISIAKAEDAAPKLIEIN